MTSSRYDDRAWKQTDHRHTAHPHQEEPTVTGSGGETPTLDTTKTTGGPVPAATRPGTGDATASTGDVFTFDTDTDTDTGAGGGAPAAGGQAATPTDVTWDDVAPALRRILIEAGAEWGPTGVAHAAVLAAAQGPLHLTDNDGTHKPIVTHTTWDPAPTLPVHPTDCGCGDCADRRSRPLAHGEPHPYVQQSHHDQRCALCHGVSDDDRHTITDAP